MTARKPLAEGCTGTSACPVDGHRQWRGGGHVTQRWGHIDLTAGQRKTLAEQEAAK